MESKTNADYIDDLTLLANTSAQVESLLHSLEQAAKGISLYVNSDTTYVYVYIYIGYREKENK